MTYIFKEQIVIPQIINILKGFITEFFTFADDDEDDDWKLLLNYLRESIKGGIPFKHIPFRLNVKAKVVHRTAWLSIIYGLQNKYSHNLLESYQDIFEKKEDIIRAEKRLNKLVEKYDLDFSFDIKIDRAPA